MKYFLKLSIFLLLTSFTIDFAQAQTTLREKGLEQDITQVTQDATKALQGALGQGTVSQLGVNV